MTALFCECGHNDAQHLLGKSVCMQCDCKNFKEKCNNVNK